jgi:hypothetical protein
MGLNLVSVPIPVAMAIEDGAIQPIFAGLIDCYGRVRESGRRMEEAWQTGLDYKQALREHLEAKSLFTSYALEYARLVSGAEIE